MHSLSSGQLAVATATVRRATLPIARGSPAARPCLWHAFARQHSPDDCVHEPGDGGALKRQSIVSRSSASDVKQAGPDGAADGLYGIGAGVSVAEGKGFWINSVKSGGPAEAAGVRKGDLLISIDGRRPSSLGMLRSLLLGPKGTAVDLGLQRKDSKDTSALSGAGSWIQVAARVVRGGSATGGGQGPVLGIGMGFKVSAGGGFVVSNVQHGGPAERAGVQAGDVICTYNGEALSNKAGSFLTGALPCCLSPAPLSCLLRAAYLCLCTRGARAYGRRGWLRMG